MLFVVASWVTDAPSPWQAHYRRRANTRAYYTPFSGAAGAPCDEGARFNRYAFDNLDVGRIITVVSDPQAETHVISDGGGVVRTRSATFGSRAQDPDATDAGSGGTGWPGGCQCRTGSTCRLGAGRGREWCHVASALHCGDVTRSLGGPDSLTDPAFSFNACNLPNATELGFGHTRVATRSACRDDAGELSFGSQSSVAACAQRCRDHPGCTHFIFGVGGVAGRCIKVISSSPACDGFDRIERVALIA